MTPEEAKAKACPWHVDGPNCIGERCMAWRRISKTDGDCALLQPTIEDGLADIRRVLARYMGDDR